MSGVKLSVLANNLVRTRGFLAEHGLSLFLELEGTSLLFDTGQSDVYCRNAQRMGIDLTKTGCIVLSHDHFDHCDGLFHFPWANHAPPVYVQQSAFAKRLMQAGDALQEIGISWRPEDQAAIRDRLQFVDGVKQLAPGVVLCGKIPMDEAAKKAAAPFFVDFGSGLMPDSMEHEQMLAVDREEGLYLFLGCSHPGILNCLDYAADLFPGKKIAALAAGMHLESASSQQVDAIVSRFEALRIETVMPLHCTGIVAICEMKRRLGDRCKILYTGETLEL